MNIGKLLHSYYKKDDLERVLQLLEQYAIEQKDKKLLTIIHTQQARMAALKKRYQIEGAHNELNVERNQLRAAIQENFATIDDSYILADSVIVQQIKNNFIPVNHGLKPYKWLLGALFFLIIGLYLGWWFVHKESNPAANHTKMPMIDSIQLGKLNPAIPSSPENSITVKKITAGAQTSNSAGETHTKESAQIALRFQSNQLDNENTYRANINSVLLDQNIGTVVYKEGAVYAHLIDCQVLTEEKIMALGINESAIQYTMILKINIVNDTGRQCYSKVFQSRPLIGYDNADNNAIFKKAFRDVIGQFSITPVRFCK